MRTTTAAIIIAVGCFVSAFGAVPAYLDDDAAVEVRIKDAMSRMTLEEKVALCHAQSKFSSAGVPRLGIPELWMDDGPHGVREELGWNTWSVAKWTNDSCTAFPALTCLAATWNPRMAAVYGKAIGEEARYRKKDVLLGPGVNIYRSPLGGRNFEYMGEDPFLASMMCVPYIQGVQSNGVAACVKHYALNEQEQWRNTVDVEVSDRALYEIYLPAFKAAVQKGGVWSIMGSYNLYQGVHCCHNDRLLNKILKGEWNFDGAVITDWGGCHDTDQSALNGLDLEMGTRTDGLTTDAGADYDSYYYLAGAYRKKLKAGELPMSSLDMKVERILRLMYRTSMNRFRPYGSFASPEHAAVAREIADEGIVLLKNEPAKGEKKPLLPIVPGQYGKILVVGENATRNLMLGGGSSQLKPKRVVSALEALRETYGDAVLYAEGYRSPLPPNKKLKTTPQAVSDSLRAAALKLAQDADLILFIGGLNKNFGQDCESGDRKEFGLPFGQDALIGDLQRLKKKMAVVIISGNAVAMPWAKDAAAVVQGWYLGSEIGHSLVDVLSGAVNPSGKLPFSIPFDLNDCGANRLGELSFPGIETRENYQKEKYMEDILVGYRWYDTKGIKTRYPFGYGMSYTAYRYGTPSVSASQVAVSDTLTLTVPVENVGKMDGKEVVQVYVGLPGSKIFRAVKELKAFDKVPVRAGATETVTLRMTPRDWGYFDEKSHTWKTETGKYRLYIGASSTDIRAVKDVVVK